MVLQQGMYEEMGVMLGEIEAGWVMESTNCDVVMSGTRASRESLR